MENNDYIKFMKQQQEMILKQQQQISSLLEMQQTQKIQQENQEYVQDLNPTYEEEIQYLTNKYNITLVEEKSVGFTNSKISIYEVVF